MIDTGLARAQAGAGLVLTPPVAVALDARITGQDVDMLRALLEREGRTAAIDLKDILLVDREVVKLLALCESNGNELRNCPLYIREWITREREALKR